MIINLWSTSLGGGFEGSYNVNLGSFGTVTVVAPFTTLVASTGESIPGYLIEDPTETVHNITSAYSTYVAYNLPNAKTVPSSTFLSFNSIMSVNLSQVESIGTDAFRDALGLQYVGNLANAKEIHSNAFQGATALSNNLTLLNCVSLGDNAFESTKVTNITFGVTSSSSFSIGNSAFRNCTKLSNQNLDLKNTYAIGSNAFENVGINELHASNVVYFGSYCFQNVNRNTITSYTINFSEITTIGTNALQDISLSSSILSFNSLGHMGIGNFINKSIVTSIYNGGKAGNEDVYAIQNITDFSNLEYITTPRDRVVIDKSTAFPNLKEIHAYYVGLTNKYGFQNCSLLSTLPLNLPPISVLYTHFMNCHNLTKARISFEYISSYQALPSDAFKNCSALSQLYIQMGGRSDRQCLLSSSPFENCVNLDTIIFGKVLSSASLQYLMSIDSTLFTSMSNRKWYMHYIEYQWISRYISMSNYSSHIFSYYFEHNLLLDSIVSLSDCIYFNTYPYVVEKSIFDKYYSSIYSHNFYYAAVNNSHINLSCMDSTVFSSSSIVDLKSYSTTSNYYSGLKGSQYGLSTEFLSSVSKTYSNVFIGSGIFQSNAAITKISSCFNYGIGSYAFADCIKLSNISVVMNSSAVIQPYAFKNTAITSLSLWSNSHTIEAYAFADNSKLSTLDIWLSSKLMINELAFANCSNISFIILNDHTGTWPPTLPSSNHLTSTFFECMNTSSFSLYLWPMTSRGFNLISGIQGCSRLTNVYCDDNYKSTYIPSSLFKDCINLSAISIHSCSYIGSYAFMNCGLKSTYIYWSKPFGIYNNAFENCSQLSSIDLRGAYYIGSEAFKNCSMLSSVWLNQYWNCTIEPNAFEGCPIIIPENYIRETATSITYSYNHYGSEFTITGVKEGVAKTPARLTIPSVYGPSSSTVNGVYGFSWTYNLETVILPETCIRIDSSTFYNCTNLKSINLSNIQELRQSCFVNCYSLSKIELYNMSVWSGNGWFDNCLNLQEIHISGPTKWIPAFKDEYKGYLYIYLHASELLFSTWSTSLATSYFGSKVYIQVPSSLYSQYKTLSFFSGFTRLTSF